MLCAPVPAAGGCWAEGGATAGVVFAGAAAAGGAEGGAAGGGAARPLLTVKTMEKKAVPARTVLSVAVEKKIPVVWRATATV